MNTSINHMAAANQSIVTNALFYGMKREYWEYKRMLITIPLIVTALFFLMAIVATWSHFNSESHISLDDQGAEITVSIGDENDKRSSKSSSDKSESASSENLDQSNGAKLKAKETKHQDSEQQVADGTFWFSGVYLVAAWIAAMFYALSSLYSDRRDKSILYWKTMPVAETQTVIAKFLFAVLGFSMFAILVSWLTAAVLMSYTKAVLPSLMMHDGDVGMNLTKLVIWPLLTVVIALFWCAPVFALLLFVSAFAKKMPIVLFIVPVIVVRVIERVVLGSNHFYDFFHSHSPWGLVASIAEMQTTGDLISTYLVDSVPSMVVGLVLAGVLLWCAAWQRDNAFEI